MKTQVDKSRIEWAMAPRQKKRRSKKAEGFITFQWGNDPYGIPIRQTKSMSGYLEEMSDEELTESRHCSQYTNKLLTEDIPNDNKMLVQGWPSFVFENLGLQALEVEG